MDFWRGSGGAVFRRDLGVVFRVLGVADFLGHLCQTQVQEVPVPSGSQTPGFVQHTLHNQSVVAS